MSQRKGLGRGFESLIPTDLLDDAFDPTAEQDEAVSELKQLPLTKVIADPDQPRRNFEKDSLEELAASIRQHGILQPIIVTANGDNYQIVAGERRFRAAQLAGLDKIPALIRTPSDQERLELSLIENLQRRDLNPIETATAYLKLKNQFNLTLDEIGQRVGNKSVSTVSNTLRLLKLPKEAQQAIADGKLTEGQARTLVGQNEAFILEVLPRIIEEEWSARRVEQYMVNARQDRKAIQSRVISDQRYESRLDHFRDRFKTDVSIKVTSKGSGQIVIKFKSEDDLKRIEELLG